MKRTLFISIFGLLVVGCNSSVPSSNRLHAGTTMDVNLAWQAIPGAQLGFYIEESIDGTNYTQVLTVPDGANFASIPVETGATYYFRMRSFNSVGDSNYTPVVTVKL